jgi:site-specific DNA-methyltransferase (adenine-specific)
LTPYYQSGGITIIHGDCRETLETKCNVVITDPPYGDTSLDWDVPVTSWANQIKTNSLWCFGSLRFLLHHHSEGAFRGWFLAQDIIWEKHNGSSFHADRFKRVHELVVHWYKGAWADIYRDPQFTNDATSKTVRRKHRPPHTGHIEASSYRSEDGGPRLMRSVIKVRSCHGSAEHPTQKPLGILRPLIAYSCPPGGVVFDPFTGSGSVLVAAKELGRRAVGVEINERYCEIAARRLDQEVFAFGARAE